MIYNQCESITVVSPKNIRTKILILFCLSWIGLSIFCNLTGLSLYPFTEYRLYSKAKVFWYYSIREDGQYIDLLKYHDPFFFPFNRHRFEQSIFWKTQYCQNQIIRSQCLKSAKELIESQILFYQKKSCQNQLPIKDKGPIQQIFVLYSPKQKSVKIDALKENEILLKTRFYKHECPS